jgi:pimeloyl-ACP methyl ester carboxylesterase
MKTVVSKDGTTIAYDVSGSGPALIFIAGATCFRNFMPIKADAKAFAKDFTVYNYDRRGRGDSGNTMPYDRQRELEDIEALIDAAGGKAMLYGHSSGAVLALEAALLFPEKISKVAIYDAAYVHSESEKSEYGQLIRKVKGLISEAENAKALRTFLVGIGMPKVFVYMLRLMPGWKTMKALSPTLLYDMDLTKDLPPLNRLAKIRVPSAIYYGEKSPVSMASVGKQIAGVIEGSQLVEMKGQDHMVNAKVLSPIFLSFLNQ